MITVWVFLFLMALPAFWIRFRTEQSCFNPCASIFFSYLTGICQDLFIGFEQLFLLVLLKTFFPCMQGVLFGLFVFGSMVLQLYLVLDGILYRIAAIRMEVSFFSLVSNAKCFWDSAKEKRVCRFVPITLLFLGASTLTYWFYWKDLQALQLQNNWIGSGLVIGIIGGLGHFFSPKKMSYATDHIAFQHQLWCLRKLFRFIKRKKDRTDMGELARIHFRHQNEKKSTPSLKYPLFKYTQGFTGEKSFNLSIEAGEMPHVIFLFMESFRAKNVGALGAKKGVTPHFDSLSERGILFTDFYANSVRTSRSVVSSLFGIPSDVDGSEVASKAKVPFIGMPQLMKKKGYVRSYFHNGPLQFEKQDDFFALHDYDIVHGKEQIAKNFPKMRVSSWGLPDECLIRYAADFLAQNQATPQFLTLFTITNHHPWILPDNYCPPSFPSNISDIYRKYLSTFHYSDACLGLFIDLLRQKNLLDKTLLFILGDHGYPMGEHGNFIEQRYLYEENIRVPLMIYGEGRIAQPKKIETPGSQLDLVPTLMDILGLQGFNLSIGNSLMRNIGERDIFFHNPYVFKNFGCRRGKYKLIHTQISEEIELYDLEKDPDEMKNIALKNPTVCQQLLQNVKEYEQLFHNLYAARRIVPEENQVSFPCIFGVPQLD